MKILRYHQIKETDARLNDIKGRYKLNPSFNLQNCQGEIIILMGSRTSCTSWLRQSFPNQANLLNKKLARVQSAIQVPTEAEPYYKSLSPIHSIYKQVYQVIDFYQSSLDLNQKRSLTEQYLTAAGLQPYCE